MSSSSSSSLSSDGQGHGCDARAADWVLLVFTIIAINVSWWFFRIPILWRQGVREYLKSVSWECARVYMPGFALVVCLRRTRDPTLWPSLYYLGPPEDRREMPRALTRFEYIQFVLIDLLLVVPAIMSLVMYLNHVQQPEEDVSTTYTSSLLYPFLPVALSGYVLIGAAALKLRRKYAIIMEIVVLAIALLIGILCLALIPDDNKGWWIPTLFFYLIVVLPLGLFHVLIFNFGLAGAITYLRAGMLATSAMSPNSSFPFCSLNNKAFGFTYIAVGVLAGLFALYGRHHWHPFPLNLRFNKFGQWLRTRWRRIRDGNSQQEQRTEDTAAPEQVPLSSGWGWVLYGDNTGHTSTEPPPSYAVHQPPPPYTAARG